MLLVDIDPTDVWRHQISKNITFLKFYLPSQLIPGSLLSQNRARNGAVSSSNTSAALEVRTRARRITLARHTLYANNVIFPNIQQNTIYNTYYEGRGVVYNYTRSHGGNGCELRANEITGFASRDLEHSVFVSRDRTQQADQAGGSLLN